MPDNFPGVEKAVGESIPDSPTRARTRSRIIQTAIAVLGQDDSATLATIAQAAGVGRTTVHRYFPERTELLKAVARETVEQIREAVRSVCSHSHSLEAALDEMIRSLLPFGPIMVALDYSPGLLEDQELWAELGAQRAGVVEELFARYPDSLRSGMRVDWASTAFWGLLYTGWEEVLGERMSADEAVDFIGSVLGVGILNRRMTP